MDNSKRRKKMKGFETRKSPTSSLLDSDQEMPKVYSGMTKIPPKIETKSSKDKTDEEKDSDILAEAKKRFEYCTASTQTNRKMFVEDLDFFNDKQYPQGVIADAVGKVNPLLTINKMKTLVHQITNDLRQNRPAITYSPVGNKTDKESAKILQGIVKAVERNSNADDAYDTGQFYSVSGGFGYWRVDSDYCDPDSFDQDLRVIPIKDPCSVYLDPDIQHATGADSEYGFISEMIPRDEFKRKYPDARPVPWNKSGYGEPNLKSWSTQQQIRIAEYYRATYETRRLVSLSNGHVGFYDELHEDIKTKISDGILSIENERESEIRKIEWYKITGYEILERKDWPGQYIPIIQTVGDEISINGKVYYSGIIRSSKDAQRMYNYAATKVVEGVALQPKAPFIAEEGQLEGHEDEWKMANIVNMPVLTYKGTSIDGTPIPPPQRQAPVGVFAAAEALKQSSSQDIQATSGQRFDATINERTYDESGKALKELRRNTDITSFHFVDNFSKSLKHTGVILADLIPHFYDTNRIVTILREDNSEDVIQIDPYSSKSYEEKRDPEGKMEKKFNPKVGKYGVVVTIGPSYATKRIEAQESMMGFARTLPQAAALIDDLIASNMDWEQSEEVARRLASTKPASLLAPANKDISPQLQSYINQLQNQLKQLQQSNQQLQSQITDTSKDRAVLQDKVNKDFESKLLSIAQKIESDKFKYLGQNVENEFKKISDQLNKMNFQTDTNAQYVSNPLSEQTSDNAQTEQTLEKDHAA